MSGAYTRGTRARRGDRDAWRDISVALALVTLFMLAARIFIGRGVSIGHVMAILTLPLWIGAVIRSGRGRLIVLLTILALVNGVWLTAFFAPTHNISDLEFTTNIAELLSVVMILGVFLWASTLVRAWVAATAVGLGLVVSAVSRPALFLENPWKYALGLPIAALLLALAMAFRRRVAELLVLILLAAVSAAMDSRSFFGVFAIGIVLTIWQMLPARRRTTPVEVLMAVTAVALVVYVVGTTLLLGGYLGEAAQARSIMQQDRAGSVIVGGRPEMAATAALFLHNPLGFGPGTLVTPTELLAVKAGMWTINYDPDNGWVDNYMFGDRIELHSTLGDLWAYWGIAGIMLVVVALVILFRRASLDLAERSASALLVFTVIISAWNVAFNPTYSSLPYFGLALGLALTPRSITSGAGQQHAQRSRRRSQGLVAQTPTALPRR
ncbi:hypothetical protein [Microbacterium sp.]|uniref:hypothetical protein n=1 Tax=Microbacterium sp. TaxID=51671 RepID=UPI0039E60815